MCAFDEIETPTEQQIHDLIKAQSDLYEIIADYCRMRAEIDPDLHSPGTGEDVGDCTLEILGDRIEMWWEVSHRCGDDHYYVTFPLAHLWDPMAKVKIEAEVGDRKRAAAQKAAEQEAKKKAAQKARDLAELERLQAKYAEKA